MIRIRIQAKRIHYQENLKNFIKKRSYPMFCGVILLKYHFSVHNWVKKINLFSVFNGFVGSGSCQFFIRIRIQGIDTDSTDPDPPTCLHVSDSPHSLELILYLPDYLPIVPSVVPGGQCGTRRA